MSAFYTDTCCQPILPLSVSKILLEIFQNVLCKK